MVGLPQKFIREVTELGDQTIARFDLFRETSRREFIKRITILTVASFAIPLATKNIISGDHIQYRPAINLAFAVALSAGSLDLKNLLPYKNFGKRGLDVTLSNYIQSVGENLIQQPAQANYAPHRSHDQGRSDGDAPHRSHDQSRSDGTEEPLDLLPPEIPIEDIAETLAQNTTGTLIIAPSGCGKTTLVRAAMNKIDRIYQGKQDFTIVDCKGDEDGWLGIENDRDRFMLLDDDSAIEGLERLDQIKGQLKYNRQHPLIAIIDEWNNGISSIENSVEVESATKAKKAAKSSARQIVTKGRSKKVLGWLTTHTPETQSIGLDSATRQSLDIIILARKSKLGLLNQILQGKGYDFVDDSETREYLFAQFTQYRKSPDFNPEVPIALTNLGGNWRLAKLPNYSVEPLQYWTGEAQQLIEDEDWEDDDDLEEEHITDRHSNKSMQSVSITVQESEADSMSVAQLKAVYQQWATASMSKSEFIKDKLGRPAKKFSGDRYPIGREILDRAIKLANKHGWDDELNQEDSAKNT